MNYKKNKYRQISSFDNKILYKPEVLLGDYIYLTTEKRYIDIKKNSNEKYIQDISNVPKYYIYLKNNLINNEELSYEEKKK